MFKFPDKLDFVVNEGSELEREGESPLGDEGRDLSKDKPEFEGEDVRLDDRSVDIS